MPHPSPVLPPATAPSAPPATAPSAPPATAPGAPTGAGPCLPRASTSPLPAGTLLALGRRGLVEAAESATPADRYAAAHLSALRAAAAVLACRARPCTTASRRSRPTSAWVLLASIAPELGEWSAFFAAGARKRAAAEAGLTGAVTCREADDLLRDAETFLAVVETTLGLTHQQLLASG